jgi:hypothetical protein
MNLAQIEGKFESPISLAMSLLKLYLKYDFELIEDSANTLKYSINTGQVSLVLKQTISGIKIMVGKEILTWNLAELFKEQVEFPLIIPKGDAKEIFIKDGLSSKLAKLKEMLINNVSTEGKEPVKESPSKKAKQDVSTQGQMKQESSKMQSQLQEVPSSIRSSRVEEGASSLFRSGGIPHGVGIPSVPAVNQPEFIRPGGRFGIGDVDLDPFGNMPGIRPMNPMHPGGGMHVGPDHPMFQPPLHDRRGPFGPPPGARFDPVMPFGPGGGRPIRPGYRNRPPFR